MADPGAGFRAFHEAPPTFTEPRGPSTRPRAHFAKLLTSFTVLGGMTCWRAAAALTRAPELRTFLTMRLGGMIGRRAAAALARASELAPVTMIPPRRA